MRIALTLERSTGLVDAATGLPLIVMERLRGLDLSTLLARSGALEPEPAVALFLQACDALSAAHRLGIAHRDIKPSNLFLHEVHPVRPVQPSQPSPFQARHSILLKVCDFGIAKQLAHEEDAGASTELTRTGGIIGSPLYMSPEQAKSSKNVDARTDVFSLAMTMHEALSGERPWAGRTSMGEIIVAVCTEDVPSLTMVAPWVDPGLSAVIAKALQRDVAARYASIEELAAALAPFGTRRTLAPEDLAGVPSARRTHAQLTRNATTNPEAKRTGDAVSVTADRPGDNSKQRRRWPALLAAGFAVVAVAAGGTFAFTRLRAGPTVTNGLIDSSGGRGAFAPATSGTGVTTTDALPSSTGTSIATSSDAGADASTTDLAASQRVAGPPPIHRPRPVPVTTAPSTSATSVALPVATPGGVGRGFTATELPPSPSASPSK